MLSKVPADGVSSYCEEVAININVNSDRANGLMDGQAVSWREAGERVGESIFTRLSIIAGPCAVVYTALTMNVEAMDTDEQTSELIKFGLKSAICVLFMSTVSYVTPTNIGEGGRIIGGYLGSIIDNVSDAINP